MKSFMTNLVTILISVNAFAISIKKEKVAPGIYKLTIGKVDKYTPFGFSSEAPKMDAISKMGEVNSPFNLENIVMNITSRGCSIAVPLADKE